MNTKQKLEYVIQRHKQLDEYYALITTLAIIAIDRGLRLIIENPATPRHYLSLYWPLTPTLIDNDRRDRGDYYKKPTQYWFINCEPKNNLVFEPLEDIGRNWNIERQTAADGHSRVVRRSMIHPQYARRFIMEFIL